MTVIRTSRELRSLLDAHRASGGTVGLIGTSGGLHEGHLSLIRFSRRAGHFTVLWLFNGKVPIATGITPGDARNYAADQIVGTMAGASVIFMPPNESLFPSGAPLVRVEVDRSVAEPWPESGSGVFVTMVATMMAKAVSIVGPCLLFCGEKDWQNAAVLRRMVSDLSLSAEIVICPSVREPDGLVLGSRNSKLTNGERRLAPQIKKALDAASALVEQGERTSSHVEEAVRRRLAGVGNLDYVKVVDPHTLEPLVHLEGDIRILVSVSFSQTSLVDSVGLNVSATETASP